MTASDYIQLALIAFAGYALGIVSRGKSVDLIDAAIFFSIYFVVSALIWVGVKINRRFFKISRHK